MDARQLRTRARLHVAVLTAARDAPIDDLSVTALARAAHVHRSTFYEHAASPGDLLRQALLAELDDLRADLLSSPDVETDEAVAETTRRVLEHVRAHAPIYRRGLAADAGSGSLEGMLGDHFLESSRQLLRAGRVHLPLHVAGLADEDVADVAARFVSRATVGAIQGWLDLPGEPGVEVFRSLYAVLLPGWWVQQRRSDV